jgi:hypothetical protein
LSSISKEEKNALGAPLLRDFFLRVFGGYGYRLATMASSSTGTSKSQGFDIINGKWIIHSAVTGDPEFRLLWTAYKGRNRVRFLREETEAKNDASLDTFLKLASNKIHSTNPFGTLYQAIVYYGLCSSVREQDFDLLKSILDFFVEYHILTEARKDQLREEISIRVPAKRAADTARIARRQRTAEEALAQRHAELADEAFWESAEVKAEVEQAEKALETPSVAPSQELVVLAGGP